MAKQTASRKTPAKKTTSKQAVKQDQDLGFLDMSQESMEGFDIKQTDMSIPFLKVLQSTSPEVKKKGGDYVEGAEEGLFINSTTQEIYNPEEMKVIVIKWQHVYQEWKPDRGGLAGVYDPEAIHTLNLDKSVFPWRTEDGNEIKEAYIYYLLIVGKEHEGPVVLALNSTNIPKAKKWNKLLISKVVKGRDGGPVKAPPYCLVWGLKTFFTENDKGSWYGIDANFAGYVDNVQYESVKSERIALPERSVNLTQLTDDAGKSSGSDESMDI